ncbi:MAG: S24 family peptidase [bacterium]|nr:S24 family peptidase [bacterium]
MKRGIGEYIYNIREKNGGKGFWSLRSVAKRAKISDAYLSQLENGKVKHPLPDILRNISIACRQPYEDFLCAAGYLTPKQKTPKILEIPVYKDVPDDKTDLIYDEIISINYEFIGNNNCFALKMKGDYLNDNGISKGDIIIVSRDVECKNGDLVIARITDLCKIKTFYKLQSNPHPKIVLQPCRDKCESAILLSEEIEIIGKITQTIKRM